VVWRDADHRVSYDVIADAGASIGAFTIDVDGANRLDVLPSGELVIETAIGRTASVDPLRLYAVARRTSARGGILSGRLPARRHPPLRLRREGSSPGRSGLHPPDVHLRELPRRRRARRCRRDQQTTAERRRSHPRRERPPRRPATQPARVLRRVRRRPRRRLRRETTTPTGPPSRGAP
jgi:hypothetical protein